MNHSKSQQVSSPKLIWVWPLLIIIPLILGWSWGMHFSENVYVLLRYAQNLASGHGFSYQSVAAGLVIPVLPSPLMVTLLGVAARVGIPVAPAAGLMSLLGWSASGITFLIIGSTIRRPWGGLLAAILLVFNPWIITTLGDPTSWIIALFWITLACLLRRKTVLSIFSIVVLLLLLIQWPLEHIGTFTLQLSEPLIWSAVLLLAAIGAEWAAEVLVKREMINLNSRQTIIGVLAIVLILFGSSQLLRLWQLYQLRPLALWHLESDIGSWLRSNTKPSEKLLASGKIGFLAQRQTITVQQVGSPDDGRSQQEIWADIRPDYVITDQSVPWQSKSASSWFQLYFQQVRQFRASNVAAAPYTAWSSRSPLKELEPPQSINARIPDLFRVIGYQIGPGTAQPGESIRMALYLEALEFVTELPKSFTVIARLVSPIDNTIQGSWEIKLPKDQQPHQWQANEVIVEELLLPLPLDLEAGAYNFNLSFHGPESDELWPISLDNDMNRLDRVPTGSIVVPWPGNLDGIQRREVNFGDEVYLIGYIIDGDSDSQVNTILYWQTDQAIDRDYTVFVHIVDEVGNLVASHDSQPANGRFPTTTWRKDIIVEDLHLVNIPQGIPEGSYQINVGVYTAESGERLQIIDDSGTLTTEDFLPLQNIVLP